MTMYQSLIRYLLICLVTVSSTSWAACVQGFVSGLYFVSNCSPEVLVKIAENIPSEELRQRFREYLRQSYQSGDSVSADIYLSVSPFVSQVGVSRSEVYEECDEGSYCPRRTVFYINDYQPLTPARTFEQEFGFSPPRGTGSLSGSVYGMDVQNLQAGLSAGVARSGLVAVQLIQSGALVSLGETFKAHWKVLMHGSGPDLASEQALATVRAEGKALLSLAQSEIHAQSEPYLAAGMRLEQDFQLLKVHTEAINKELLDSLRRVHQGYQEREPLQTFETQIKELSKASLAAYKDSETRLRELQLGRLPRAIIEGYQRGLKEALQNPTDPEALTKQIIALQQLEQADKNPHRREQYHNLLSAYVDEQGLLAPYIDETDRQVVGALRAAADTPLGQTLRGIYNETLTLKGQGLPPETYFRLLETLKASDDSFASGDRKTGNLLLNRVRSFLDYQSQDPRTATYRAVQPSAMAAQLFQGLKSPAQSFGEFQALQLANQLAAQPAPLGRVQSLGQEIIDDIIAAELAGDATRLMGRIQAGQIVLGVDTTRPKLREVEERGSAATPWKTFTAQRSMQMLNTALDKVANKEDAAAQRSYELGMALADLALGVAPGIGWMKDVYEAIAGKNLVTGVPLSRFERASALLGAVTIGIGSKLGQVGKLGKAVAEGTEVLGKHADRVEDFVEAEQVVKEVLDAAKKIGFKSGEKIKQNIGLLQRWSPHFKATKIEDAAMINKGYGQPPYLAGSKVVEFETSSPCIFHRVYGANSTKEGSWLLKKEDIEGLSPVQIKDKFNLPEIPTHMTEVNLPSGTPVRTGLIGPNSFGSSQGAVQYELMKKIDKDLFTNNFPL